MIIKETCDLTFGCYEGRVEGGLIIGKRHIEGRYQLQVRSDGKSLSLTPDPP